ncbi:lipopolysaccharide biosynthesis protein [Roseomonas elaeocarpi]|uniref:Lipopolysaccharide biosynthesis protein n=1 Tax=Roseomonas elaeocarpi TaxID=907779 RepID=A0ABV6JLW6_9PROT
MPGTTVLARRFPVPALLLKPAVFGSLIPTVTALNALVGLLLPMLMTPGQFGEYSLVVTLFQYGLIFDLGASQLADRRIPAQLGGNRPEEAERLGQRLLWLRLYIAAATAVVLVLVLTTLAVARGLPFRLEAALLAGLAGLLYMVSLGPACIYRARSLRRNYAVSIAVLSSGLVVARLSGMLLGGTVGCFVALGLWYGAFAVLLHWQMPPRLAERPGPTEAVLLVGQGLALFATSFMWAFHVTANRWFAAQVIPAGDFGQFAFAANIFALLVGTASGFSAFYYPKFMERLAGAAPFALSRLLLRDCARLLGATAAITAVGLLLAGPMVGYVYPAYTHSAADVRVLLVAVPPLVLASWLMPISLSAGRQPWIDGLVVYPAATVLLCAAIFLLVPLYGGLGAGAASTLSSLPLVAMQLLLLSRARVLRAPDAAALFGVALLGCAGLAALAWMVGA